MPSKDLIHEMAEHLDANGEISFLNVEKNIFIESIDDKEGYSFVSNTHEEFKDSIEAVRWAAEYLGGIEKIQDWR